MIARTWILVADATYARIFEISEESQHWELVQEFQHLESREQGRDLIGNRPNKAQHLMEMAGKKDNPVEFKLQEAMKFAQELTTHLDKQVSTNSFDQLVVVAPPKMLGALREKMSNQLKRLVVTEVDKDYSHMKPAEMEERVPIF